MAEEMTVNHSVASSSLALASKIEVWDIRKDKHGNLGIFHNCVNNEHYVTPYGYFSNLKEKSLWRCGYCQKRMLPNIEVAVKIMIYADI